MTSLIFRVTMIGALALSATLGQPLLHLSPKAALAQDAPMPKPGKIDAEARRLLDEMIAVYASMKSYSGTTRVEMREGSEPKSKARHMEANIFVQKPDRAIVRYKSSTSESGVAVYDGSHVFVRSSRHKTEYIKRNIRGYVKGLLKKHAENRPYHEIGITNTLIWSGMVGRGLDALLTQPELIYKDPLIGPYISLSLDQPDVVAGIPVSTVIWEMDQGHFFKATATYFIGKEDHLLHRLTLVLTSKGQASRVTQTHTNIKINAKLPASTFTFTPPRGAKPVQRFSSAK